MTTDPLTPRDAKAWYLEEREDELRDASLRRITAHLDRFIEYTDKESIDTLEALTGRDLH